MSKMEALVKKLRYSTHSNHSNLCDSHHFSN